MARAVRLAELLALRGLTEAEARRLGVEELASALRVSLAEAARVFAHFCPRPAPLCAPLSDPATPGGRVVNLLTGGP